MVQARVVCHQNSEDIVQAKQPQPGSMSLVKVFEGLTILALALMVLGVISTAVGPNGLGIASGGLIDSEVMSVDAELDFPVDFGDRLEWTDTSQGTVDAATGLPPVEFAGPVTAQLLFWSPTTAQRTAWVLWKIAGPLLGIAGAALILRMTRDARNGDPFSPANESRLWKLAFLVAIGGSAVSWVGAAVRAWLIESSAAADSVSLTFTLVFTPIIVGIGIALLASVWRVGVGLREDVDGMV